MGKRKAMKQTSKTQFSGEELEEDHGRLPAHEEEGGGGKFFACYLLTSLCPRFKGHTYIGFTVNPRRRIRQHNGEIGSGAFRTKRKRPWEMVMCIYGFPTNVAALQFEWAWQHPVESLAVRKAAATFKSRSGVGNKIKLAYTMLTLPSWQSLNLTVNFFSSKYKQQTVGCPSLPGHMRVQVCSMDELPCYSGNSWNSYENDEWNIQEECDNFEPKESLNDNILEDTFFPDSTRSQCCNEENVIQKSNCTEERTLEHGRSEEIISSLVDKDHKHFSLDDSPVRKTSFSSSYSLVDTFQDGELFLLRDDHDPEPDQPFRKYSPPITVVADGEKHSKNTSSISSEVEVIDIFTPSPCYTTNFGTKKRRLSIVCPEIIDLTESPIVV